MGLIAPPSVVQAQHDLSLQWITFLSGEFHGIASIGLDAVFPTNLHPFFRVSSRARLALSIISCVQTSDRGRTLPPSAIRHSTTPALLPAGSS